MENPDRIVYHLEQALALDSLYAAPRLALAQRLLEKQHQDAAASMFAQALSVADDQSKQLAQAATVCMESHNFDRAKQLLLKALDQNLIGARAALELGLISLETGDIATARAQFTHAVELDPDFALAYFQLALLEQHQPVAACEQLLKAVVLDFGFAKAHLELARLLEDAGDAEYHYRIALDLNPDLGTEQLARRFG